MTDTIVIGGAVAQRPGYGGHTWQFLQYLLGLRRLGWDVLFVDQLDAAMCVDEAGEPCPVEESVNLRYLVEVMERCGLGDAYALIYNRGERVCGVSRAELLERVRRAPPLLNVMGYIDDEDVLGAAQRRIFLDTDPGFGQMWRALGWHDLFSGHDVLVTIGENIGRPECGIPTCGLHWHTTPQPVVLAQWPPCDQVGRDCFTSVGSWRGPYAPIEFGGQKYGLRVHEFRKFAALPCLSGYPFEVALDIHSAECADLALLADNGWTLIDPRAVSRDPWVYRSYIHSSKAEFMVAKGIYVQTTSGWFSERSICYLASGKPVVAQDTGLADLYPVGAGLLTFSTLDEAREATDEVWGNYAHHALAARELAEAYFDSDKVLSGLLGEAGGRVTTVAVSGALANKCHNGGEAWVRLSYVLGLRRLGCRVFFIEQIAREACRDAAGAVVSFAECCNRTYFDEVVTQFGLRGSATLVYDDGVEVHGASCAELLDLAGEADLLVNVSGHLTLDWLFPHFRRTAYIDVDPGFTQFWHCASDGDFRLVPHDVFFTVGANIGQPDCPIPTGGIQWRPTRPPVVLEDWPVSTDGDPERCTTIGSWRGPYGRVEYGGRSYGLKVHEFRKFLALPQRAPQTFELALSIHPADEADLQALRQHGWQVVDPREVTGDPLAFRRYIQGSGAECSVAQGIYVETNSGWFSDRTVRYLASGKPALIQETGFSRHMPSGEGLISFRTLDGAVAGAECIARDYAGHCQAARALAETYFDSDGVLSRLLDEAGVAS